MDADGAVFSGLAPLAHSTSIPSSLKTRHWRNFKAAALKHGGVADPGSMFSSPIPRDGRSYNTSFRDQPQGEIMPPYARCFRSALYESRHCRRDRFLLWFDVTGNVGRFAGLSNLLTICGSPKPTPAADISGCGVLLHPRADRTTTATQKLRRLRRSTAVQFQCLCDRCEPVWGCRGVGNPA